VVGSWLAADCCGYGTGTIREPRRKEHPSLEAVTRGLLCEDVVVGSWLVGDCCGCGTGTVREPRRREHPSLVADTEGPLKTWLAEKTKGVL
jgi:hypothetical protein